MVEKIHTGRQSEYRPIGSFGLDDPTPITEETLTYPPLELAGFADDINTLNGENRRSAAEWQEQELRRVRLRRQREKDWKAYVKRLKGQQ